MLLSTARGHVYAQLTTLNRCANIIYYNVFSTQKTLKRTLF